MVPFKTGRKVAPFFWNPETEIHLMTYPMGGLAIMGMADEEEWYVATLNLAPYGSRQLQENEVWLKGWSENEGVPEALSKAGIITLTGETMQAGMGVAQLGVIEPKLMDAYHAWDPDKDEDFDDDKPF